MENIIPTQLQRKLGLFPITNIVIANMIGAGIFMTSGLLMNDIRNPLLMLLLWIIGGIIALCGALSYGELGANIPHAGGEYIFLSKLYHPLVGFLSGWISFIVGFSAPIAASSIGFSEYFCRAFPQLIQLGNTIGITSPALVKKILSIGIIILFTCIHLRGISFGTVIQNYLTILKVAMIFALLIAGFAFGRGNFQHIFQGDPFSFNFSGWKITGLSLMWIMFAYSGWNASTYIGSEVKNPTKNLPLSLFLGTGIVILLYLLLNMLFIYAVPPAEMRGVVSIGGLAVANLFGTNMGILFSLFISFALFSSLSAYIILGPRIYYSMAKEGYFFKFVSAIDPRFAVPTKALFLQAAISIIMILSGTFDQILTYMGFSLGIFPVIAVMGIFRLRYLKCQWRLPGYPVAQIFYLFTGISMLVLSFFERPVESSIAILTMLAGIPAYILFRSKKNNTNHSD